MRAALCFPAVVLVAAMAATNAVASGGFATDENGLAWYYHTDDDLEAEVAGLLSVTMGLTSAPASLAIGS